MRKQRTLDEAAWKILETQHEHAPHGYKRKAEERLKDFVHDQLRREVARQRDKAAA